MPGASGGRNSTDRAFCLAQAHMDLADILNCSFIPHVLLEINDCWELNEERCRRCIRKGYGILLWVMDMFITLIVLMVS